MQSELRMAHKDKDFKRVIELFDSMIGESMVPDMPTVNALIDAKGQLKGAADALNTLEMLTAAHASITPNSSTYSTMIGCCIPDGDKATAQSLYDTMIAKDIAPTIQVFNSMISCFAAALDFKGAEELFTKMRTVQVVPNRHSYIRFINGALKANEGEVAYRMLCNAEHDWRVPEVRNYENMLLHFIRLNHTEGQMRCLEGILAEAGEDAAKRVIPDLMRQASAPEQRVALAKVASKIGMKLERFHAVGVVFAYLGMSQPIDAFAAALQLHGDGDSLPERASKMLTDQLATHYSAVDEAYYLLEARKADGAEVPLASLNLVIEACAKMGDLDRAFATWAELDQLDLKPDAGTYNALLLTCIEARELPSGRRLIARMEQDGIVPNADTYAHHCSLLMMSRQAEQAMALFDECKAKDLVPSGKMYATLINHCLRAGSLDRVQELFEEMGTHHEFSPKFKQKIEDAIAAA